MIGIRKKDLLRIQGIKGAGLHCRLFSGQTRNRKIYAKPPANATLFYLTFRGGWFILMSLKL
jgi:hypothetical protein